MTKKSIVFSFVPQRTSADGSKPDDRRFINTHLSRLAADRRRQGKSKITNLPPVPSEYVKGAKVKISRAAPPKSSQQALVVQRKGSTDLSSSDTSDEELTEGTELASETETTKPIATSVPANVPVHGSCDPFQSTQIPITSSVHELLIFDSTMFTPWGVGIEKGDDKRGSFSNKFAQTSLEALGNKGTGYANLARLAVAASTVTQNPRLDTLATRFKMLAYSSLRESMEANGTQPDRLLMTQVFSLVSMETAARQDDNAAMHTKTLRHLIKSDPEPLKLDSRLLSSICWHESMRCALTGRRPILNIEAFVDSTPYLKTMFGTKLKLDALGLMPKITRNGFECSRSDRRMGARLKEMRFIHDLSDALQGAPHLVNDALMEAYGYRASLTYCTLWDHYNDFLDKLQQAQTTQDLLRCYTATCIALCANYSLRAISSHEPIDIEYKSYRQLYQIYSSHQPLLRQVREAHHYCKSAGGLQEQELSRVWLWILRVSTLAERADMFPHVEVEAVLQAHFHRAFVAHAKAMGLREWDEIEDICQDYLRLTNFAAKSKEYFDMAMNR